MAAKFLNTNLHKASAAKKDESDIFIVEVGGTVGEYQNVMFFEAIRRMKQAEPDNVFLIHLVYLVVPPFLGEMKSKPAQNSIYDLYKLGLQPNFVICRSQNEIDTKRKKTISFNTGIREDHILSAPDVDSIYKILFHQSPENFIIHISYYHCPVKNKN